MIPGSRKRGDIHHCIANANTAGFFWTVISVLNKLKGDGGPG
jgi:hypothetical protein